VAVDKPISPCGACRQVIAEYETLFGNNIEIIMSGETGKIFRVNSIEDLLPFMFNSKALNN
jgi:cytidine deaminase